MSLVAAGLLVVAATNLWSPQNEPAEAVVLLPDGAGQGIAGFAPHATPAPPLGRSGRSHAAPPPLESLRDQPHAQAVYDAEANPGDFVTPPVVSIEH